MSGRDIGTYASLCARSALKQVAAIRREVAGVKDGRDIECLHRMRVASRRLRCALGLLEPELGAAGRALRKPSRRITRALGAARDLDVRIAFVAGELAAARDRRVRPGLRRLMERAREDRARAQEQVMEMLATLEREDVLGAVERAVRPLAGRAAGAGRVRESRRRAAPEVARRLDALLALEGAVSRLDDVEGLHRMRIEAKHLRYALEMLAPAYHGALRPFVTAVRRAQRLLGQIHDCDMWIAYLPAFLADERASCRVPGGAAGGVDRLIPGLEELCRMLGARRAECFAAFGVLWRGLGRRRIWAQLRRAAAGGWEGPGA